MGQKVISGNVSVLLVRLLMSCKSRSAECGEVCWREPCETDGERQELPMAQNHLSKSYEMP